MPIKTIKKTRFTKFIEGAYVAMDDFLKRIIAKTDAFSDQELDLFETFFLTRDATGEVLAQVKKIYGATHTGLTLTDFEVVQGSVFPNSKFRSNKIEFSNQSSNSTRVATHYFIHEATHAFADTTDHGEKGYLGKTYMAYRQEGMTSDQALNNGDSYAGFLMAWCDLLKVTDAYFLEVEVV